MIDFPTRAVIVRSFFRLFIHDFFSRQMIVQQVLSHEILLNHNRAEKTTARVVLQQKKWTPIITV